MKSAVLRNRQRDSSGASREAQSAEQMPAPGWAILGKWISSLFAAIWLFLRRLFTALRIPVPEPAEWIRRATIMERNIMLPIKLAGLMVLFFLFYKGHWIQDISNALEAESNPRVEVLPTRHFYWAFNALFWCYAVANVVVAALIMAMRRLPVTLLQWAVFATCLMDGIFLSMLVLPTGGYNSTLFWLFLTLIVRSSVIVPRATSQIALNLTLSACFMFAGFVDVFVAKNLGDKEREILKLSADYPPEPVLVRLSLLLMLTVCCYGLQVLLERQRRAEEEAREFGLREGQLRSAGRLAAEFAHQLKNPLAIINNAVFSLRRGLKKDQPEAAEQIEMIQEEIERADRIITDVMGYAQLSEGHVEKLDVIEELDQAINRVFPPAARFPVQIQRRYAPSFPPLFMQRRHAAETFINVLQNAREALQPDGGNLFITAQCLEDHSIEISIRDDGPGIPVEKQGQIFEAYYTTKEKGTGLGLATVKQNVELYGGKVRVESALGKGARFILVFPTKTLIPAVKTTS